MENLNIIQLADFHFGEKDIPVADKISQFIESDHFVGNADFLIICGDIAALAKWEPDYRNAKKTLNSVAEVLHLDKSKIIMAPGNHDVSLEENLRFSQFTKFCNEFYDGIYKFDTGNEKLFKIFDYPQSNITAVTANSSINIERAKETRYGFIGQEQFKMIEKKLAEVPDYKERIKLFIIHHSLEPVGEMDISALRDQRYLKAFLRRNGFKLLLHGHQHFREISSIYQSDKDFLISGAGRFGHRDKYELSVIKLRNVDQPRDVQVKVESFEYNNSFMWESKGAFPARKYYRFSTSDPIIELDLPSKFYVEFKDGNNKTFMLKRQSDNLQKIINEAYSEDIVKVSDEVEAFKCYVTKLENLQDSLIATSFLASSFWIVSGHHIIETNIKTAERLKAEGKEEPVKRLFLLDLPLDRFIHLTVEQIIVEERMGLSRLRDRWNEALKNLAEMNNHIAMKVLHLPKESPVWEKLLHTEIACYDERDFDFFTCDSEKDVTGVHMVFDFNNCANDQIREDITEIIGLFRNVWDGTDVIPLSEFITDFSEELEWAHRHIKYKDNWLYSYDMGWNNEDETLKKQEAQALLSLLENKVFNNHLDIGECTGRYPGLFKTNNLAKKVTGVDREHACIKKAEENTALLSDITHTECDILDYDGNGSDFDVVTCMMGTVCEFWGHSLDLLAQKIKDITLPGAMIVMSVWNSAAINERRFVDIYHQSELERLARNMPAQNKIKKIFEENGFKYVRSKRVPRLTVLQFEKEAK